MRTFKHFEKEQELIRMKINLHLNYCGSLLMDILHSADLGAHIEIPPIQAV